MQRLEAEKNKKSTNRKSLYVDNRIVLIPNNGPKLQLNKGKLV